jgi:hypothetical protein
MTEKNIFQQPVFKPPIWREKKKQENIAGLSIQEDQQEKKQKQM